MTKDWGLKLAKHTLFYIFLNKHSNGLAMMCKYLEKNTKSFVHDDQQLLSTLCKLDIHYSERDRHPANHLIVEQVSCTWTCKVCFQAASSHYAVRIQQLQDDNIMIKICLSLKDKIRKEGKDRKKMWLSSRLHLQTCNFLLDDVLIEVLIFRLGDSWILEAGLGFT